MNLQHTHIVVFASTLKPCDDVRMYDKLAKSLDKSSNTKIYLLGQKGETKPDSKSKYIFDPCFDFGRRSFKRWFTEIVFFLKLFKIKPDKIVICTYELLFSAMLYKLLFRKKLYYDIQENYYLNIMTGSLKPSFLKYLLANYVRAKERFSKIFIDHFILAEKCYVEELSFVKKKHIVFENKALKSILEFKKDKQSTEILCCITGTLGKTYGTIESITLLKNLKIILPNLRVEIIGYCADKNYLKLIKEHIENLDFINLVGGDKLISHSKILENIAISHFTLMMYQDNGSFANKIPTKFYECMALGTYMITSKNVLWENLLSSKNAGTVIDPHNIDFDGLATLISKIDRDKIKISEDLFLDHEQELLYMLLCE